MLVQIGNFAFNPDRATYTFCQETAVGDCVVVWVGSSPPLILRGEDYTAFLDWWRRCANVTRFPNGNG